ncbi:MAG: hypothetical protein ACP5LT_01890 [Candidatus Kapaibacteriota bacterium]
MKKMTFSLVTAFLLFSLSLQLNAQGCCSISINSLGSTESEPLETGNLVLGVNFWHLNSSAYYIGDIKQSDPLQRVAVGNNVLFDIEYGLTNFLSLYLSVPYSFYRRDTKFASYSNKGFGDVLLLGKFKVGNRIIFVNDLLSLGFGVKFPTGKNNAEKDGVELPIDLQVGTGSYEFSFWSLYQNWLSNRILFTQSFLFRTFKSNLKNYKFGNEMNLNTSLYYQLIDYWLNIGALIRIQKRWKDRLDGQVVVNSGRLLIELLPGFLFDFGETSFRVNFGFPIYTRVEGSQLSILYRIGLELRYRFF